MKGVLDNPIYCGKLAYGRRKSEKISGKRNEYHVVRQADYMLYDGIHEAIVPEADWKLAQEKRKTTGVQSVKTHSLGHENILSAILRCPVCGSPMYGNVNRKKRPDGSLYKDYFFYACKHRLRVNGHRCDYRKQWNQTVIDDAVAELIRSLVQNPKFEEAIRAKINSKVDTAELQSELDSLRTQLRQLDGAKNRLGREMDTLDVTDRHYDRKRSDMQRRMESLYDQMSETESHIDEIQTRIRNIHQQRISGERVYQYLQCFDKLYDKFTDAEKKEFMNSFVERIDIYPEKLPDGRFLKHIKFRFPVYFNGQETDEISWDKESTVETVVLLSREEAGLSYGGHGDLRPE